MRSGGGDVGLAARWLPERARGAYGGFSVLRVAVVLGVIVTLMWVLSAVVQGWMVKGQMKGTLSNMRQLHLATETMAQDGLTAKDSRLVWPGDAGGSYSNWLASLVPDYWHTNDVCKLMSAPGKNVPLFRLPRRDEAGVQIYAVRAVSASNVVFLSTANFTNTAAGGLKLSRDARPYGRHGFVVFRKGGDGAILRAGQVGKTNLIGGYEPPLGD